MTVRVRFAPSPTGKVHIGNLRTALVNALYAIKTDGQFILRFEDTDLEREVKGSEEVMLDAFEALGVVPDESVRHGGDFAPYRTRERAENGDYDRALKTLFDKGLAYECYVSKEELDMIRRLRTSRGLPPGYDNRHRDLTDAQREEFKAQGLTPVIRFKLEDGEIAFDDLVRGHVSYQPQNLGGDPVIVRSNGIPTFAFAAAVDDINQKITHIVRGEDHVTNTAIQVRIFEALGVKAPAFAHLSLLLGPDGEKLSKRLDSLSIAHLIEQGYMPEAIVSYLAAIGSSTDPVLGDMKTLAERFEFSNMGRAPVRFDLSHLGRLNAEAIHNSDWADVAARVKNFLPEDAEKETDLETFWQTVRANLTLLADVRSYYDVCFGVLPQVDMDADDRSFIAQALQTLPKGPYDKTTWGTWINVLKEKSGRKGKGLFMPLRQALTGQNHGPELDLILPLLGEDRARLRLEQVAQKAA